MTGPEQPQSTLGSAAATLIHYALYVPAAAFVLAYVCFPLLAMGIVDALDTLARLFSGCGMGSIPAEITGWNAWAQVGALGMIWLLEILFAFAALCWAIAMIMLAIGAHDERRHNYILRLLKRSGLALTTLAITLPAVSQGICATV